MNQAIAIKICLRCGSSEYGFYRNKNRKDGLNAWCKGCLNEYKKRYAVEPRPSSSGPKQCTKCGSSENGFHRDKNRKDGLTPWCKKCTIANTKRYQSEGRKPVRDQRKVTFNAYARLCKKRYGITIQEVEALLAAQGGGCAICGSVPEGRRMSVDHDHQTGAIRGILCTTCNSGIGYLKDDPELIRKAANYVERGQMMAVA